MTQDPYERSVLSIFRNLLATAGTLTINMVTLPLVEFFGDNAAAWTKTFCVLGLLAVAAFMINFFGTRERVKASDADGGTQDVPIKEGILALFKNKYWIMMTCVLALFFLNYSVNGGTTVFFELFGKYDDHDCNLQHYPRDRKCLRRSNHVGYGLRYY